MPVGRRYKVHCTCGWSSPWLDTIGQARVAELQHAPNHHRTHVEAAVAPTVEQSREGGE